MAYAQQTDRLSQIRKIDPNAHKDLQVRVNMQMNLARHADMGKGVRQNIDPVQIQEMDSWKAQVKCTKSLAEQTRIYTEAEVRWCNWQKSAKREAGLKQQQELVDEKTGNQNRGSMEDTK